LNFSSNSFEIYVYWFELKKKLIIDFKPAATYCSCKGQLNKIIQKAILNK